MAEPTVQFMVSVICVLNVRAMISSGAPKLHLNFKHKGEGRVYNFFEQRPPNIKTHLRTAVRTVSKKISDPFLLFIRNPTQRCGISKAFEANGFRTSDATRDIFIFVRKASSRSDFGARVGSSV